MIPSVIYSTLSSMADLSPFPSKITVLSLVTMIYLQEPNTAGSALSKVKPMSSETTVPPVKMAISFNIAFLLSPKAGAFTAQTFNPALNLFNTKVAKASDSTSSQMINKGLYSFMECSKKCKTEFTELIFFSAIKM